MISLACIAIILGIGLLGIYHLDSRSGSAVVKLYKKHTEKPDMVPPCRGPIGNARKTYLPCAAGSM